MRSAVVCEWPPPLYKDMPVQAARLPNPGPTTEAPQAQSKPEPLLEMRAVSKTYGPVAALSGLQANIAPGEFVTVVGPSGCGKSTLFNIVAGLEEPDAGGILRFEGKSRSRCGMKETRPSRSAAWQLLPSKRRMPPASGSSRPATILKSVLLPQPLGPTTVTNSPGATLASRPANAVTWP